MRIYKIERKKCGYDEYDAHIIVASDENQVRRLAINKKADESSMEWRLAKVTLVSDYTGEKVRPFILLSSFNAG